MDVGPMTETAKHWLLTLGVVAWFYAVALFALVTADQPSPLAGVIVATPLVLLGAWLVQP